MQNNKPLYIIIIILLLIIMVMGGYLLYGTNKEEDKLTNNPPVEDKNNKEENKPNNNPPVEAKDITGTELANDLYKKLFTVDNINSMHDEKASIDNKSSDKYLTLEAISYLAEDDNVDIKKHVYNMPYDGTLHNANQYYRLKANRVKEYIKNNYNIDRTVEYIKQQTLENANGLIGTYYAKTDEYFLYMKSDSTKIYSKVTKATLEGNGTVVIHDKYFDFSEDSGRVFVYNSSNSSKTAYSCGFDADDGCLELARGSVDAAYDYLSKNAPSAIGEFKHTFKKNSNGNYYWYSTEKTN